MHRLRGLAGALHRRPWPSPAVAAVWFLDVERPALVLGSTQADPPATDPVPAVDLVRRRSGGGAVLLRPASVLWVDALVPAGDALWVADIGHAFRWLGDVWVEALAAAGVAGARCHAGPLVRSAHSATVCFAGLGPGEVSVDGRKVIGMSQRRTRDAALFQCAALLAWDAAETAALLSVPHAEIEDRAAGLAVERDVLERAFLDALATR